MHKLARADGWAPSCALYNLSRSGPRSTWHLHTKEVIKVWSAHVHLGVDLFEENDNDQNGFRNPKSSIATR